MATNLSPLLETPLEQIPDVLGEMHKIMLQLERKYRVDSITVRDLGPDRMVRIGEAAKMLGRSPRWLHDNKRDFPFTRQVGKRWVYSVRGIQDYLEGK